MTTMIKTALLFLSIFSVAIAGCGPNGGDMNTKAGSGGAKQDAAGSTGAGGATTVAGTGGAPGSSAVTHPGGTGGQAKATGADGGATAAEVATFLGRWAYTSGTIERVCPDGTDDAEQPAGVVTMRISDQPGQILIDDSDCFLLATVSGKVASVAPTRCASGVFIDAGTYTILPDGAIREQASGRVTIKDMVCQLTSDAVLVHD